MENSRNKSTIEAVEQMASDEYEKTKTRIIGGRSIDRINVDNDEEYIHSDDEGMIEEIVTTVEQDKDLECKIKKKIETKKTIAQHPDTNSTITKVVKTEVTEITRTITINDHHDLERAKRELGIDDVNRLLPLSTWNEQSQTTSQIKEKHYEPINEIVTSKDFPHESPLKQTVQVDEEKTILAESTSVGRGPVTETISTVTPATVEQKPVEIKKKKKKSKLCSCTRSSAEDEQEKPKPIVTSKQESSVPIPSTQVQGQKLISDDLKQLINAKKTLLIEYLHSKIFSPANLFSSNEQNIQAKQISSRILDLLSSDHCSSWSQMSEQLTQEYAGNSVAEQCLKPMINTYEKLFTTKQANLLNTFSTIHSENDIEHIQKNNDYLNIAQTHVHQTTNDAVEQKSDVIQTIEKEEKVNEQDDLVKENEEEPVTKELEMSNENQEMLPIYNEEYLIKMLGDISQHKPITLAEAIAYQYLDIEDPKLGLSNENIRQIKSLYRPFNDESVSNIIRVKRSGEYFTDINLSETNPFEKLTQQEPFVYQLQQTFEPTLDFNEKQFRSLIDALNNNKGQYDNIEFDVARTTVPIYDLKESSANDFSQSDSGYSMTTATHESLASKIKIEFEPIQQELGPISGKDEQIDEIEKIDIDKATQEQLDHYELNQDLIQAIKSDYNGTDKTVGQAILSRELRLDSNDLSDIAYLKSLGIYDEQKRILTAFFFPKQTRIIAYSPEPGRFVEAQTTFNPDYPGYKTDTTIIQIQEKQLSSDHFAKQRSIQDEPIKSSQIVETQDIKTIESIPSKKEILPTTATITVPAKKRKSSGCGGLLSCFGSKKAKAGTEQQGRPTVVVTPPTEVRETKTPVEEKPVVDLAVLPDGKRIYIDVFRDRPGMDMSYRPDDFENRFVLPETKSTEEYDRPITPVIETDDEPLLFESNITENEVIVQSDIEPSIATTTEDEPRSTNIESVEVQSEAPPSPVSEPESTEVIIEPTFEKVESPEVTIEPMEDKTESTEVIIESVDEKIETESQLEPREPVESQTEPELKAESEQHVHLTPRSATIEPVDVQPDVAPIIVPVHKSEEKNVIKKSTTIDLHPATVNLPEIELVKPGPLPTLPTFTKHKKETKVKKSTIGLCSACFGNKSAQKKKKSLIAEPVQPPIESEKIVIEEKQVEITPTTEIQTTTTIDKPNFSSVNIDTFRDRDFLKDSEHKFVPSEVRVEHHQPPIQEPVSTISPNIPIFSNVNIDTYLDRTLMKGAEIPPKTEQRPTTTAVVSSAEESRYQAPTNQSVVTLTEPSDLSIFSQVNIDTFRERTFQKSSENLPKSTEHFETITTTTTVTTTSQESHYQSATTESTSLSQVDKPVPSSSPNDLSIFSQVNIDDFKERSFQKSSENLPKSTEHIEQVNEAEIPSSPPPSPSEEPLLQSSIAPDEPVEVTTPVDESSSALVNIDTFKERTLQKGSESRPTSPERPETIVETVQVLEESLPQSPAVPTESTTKIVEVTTPVEESSSAPVNIDTFKERTLQKGSESRTTSPERPETIVETVQVLEESLPQSPAFPTESTTKIVEVTTPVEESSSAPINIDTFKERTLQKASESRTTSPERSEATAETVKVAEEPHYQSPTTLTESTSKPVEVSTPTDESSSGPINIDTFKERTLQKGSEIRTTSSERSDTTVGTVKVSEEPYYQSPSNKPIVTSQTTESSAKDISIYSQINIDDYRERTFEKIPKKTAKTEESPYEIPSSEPVPLISRSPIEPNTYDTPRSLELQQTSTDRQIPVMTDVQKSSGDYVTSKKIQEISPIPTTETTTIAEKKKRSFIPKKTKKSKEKTKKSSSLIPSLLCHKQQKPKIPALDLPAVERDISPNNPLREPHRRESDPFHVPAVELPALNFPLPNYDRPEANMTIGQIKQTDEFAVPAVNFSPIPNLQLPDENKQSIITTSNEMKAPSVDLPNIELTVIEIKTVKLPEIQLEKTKQEMKPTTSIIETGLALASPVDDMLSIQTDHKNFPIETDYAIKAEAIVTSITTQVIETISQTPEQQVTIIETHLVESSENEKPNLNFQLPSPEPILTISSDSKTPPSFDDDVPSPPIKIVPAVQTIEKQQIETKSELKKKSSSLRICSCFGEKSSASKEKSRPITAPKTSLPEIQMPLPSSNTSSTLKTKGPLRAPTVDLPQLNFTSESNQSTTPIPVLQQVNLSTKNDNKTVPSEPKKSSSFDIKAPSIDVPPVDLSVSTTVDAYSSREHIQSRSDSGLEQTISSPIQPSSTLADIQQLPSFSSGLGSEILDNMTVQGQSLPSITTAELKHDFTRKITLNDDIRSKLIFRENELKTRLYSEISKSIDDFDEKKDSKKLETILTDAINLIKNRHVSTYPELKQKLLAEHRNDPSLVDAVVYSLYYTIENQALDDLDKPEFPLAIRDMVRLPAKQTYDTVTHLNKESTSLTTTSMTKETLPTVSTVRSCLTCGRTKSKTTLPTPSSPSLLDERHRTELNTHRNLLGNILRDHIQSSKPPIRKFADHPKTIEKIVRKCLTLLSQPKTISYEQVRHDLKNEFKQTFYLVDPIVDITRDTFDHCDITQLNEKTNLDILDSQISQTAQIYNNQMNLLTFDEHNNFRNNHLSWLQTYLISNETTEKKLTKKQIKELTRILQRSLEILSNNTVTTWDEFNLQLQLEYPKAQDLCQRATDILRQAQRNGLFLLQNAPVQDKRRASSLITDRARQNLKTNRNQIHSLLKTFLVKYSNQTTINDDDIENILKKTLTYLEEQKPGQFKSYQDLKEQLKKDFETINQNKFIEQTVDVIEQAHATNQFDDLEKVEVQSLMRDRLDGKPLVIKEMYVSLPPRVGAYGDESGHYSSSVTNGDRTTVSYRVGRGLSWREANERARILFYRGKHPAIHYDEQSEGFDVRMVLETASGGTQEIPVTDSDVHELLNSCGVQWDGVNIISLVDHSEDVVRAAEQAALKVIREKGIVELRTPPPSASSNNDDQSSI